MYSTHFVWMKLRTTNLVEFQKYFYATVCSSNVCTKHEYLFLFFVNSSFIKCHMYQLSFDNTHKQHQNENYTYFNCTGNFVRETSSIFAVRSNYIWCFTMFIAYSSNQFQQCARMMCYLNANSVCVTTSCMLQATFSCPR